MRPQSHLVFRVALKIHLLLTVNKMKTPPVNNPDGKVEATQADIDQANARALQAREDAMALRQRLEAAEALLASTKAKLAETKETLARKDQRLLEDRAETKAISACLNGLDDRFTNLKKLQNELASKRDRLFPPSGCSGGASSESERSSKKEESSSPEGNEERAPSL